MAVTPKQYAAVVMILGAGSFVFGILAEHLKPPGGVPTQRNGFVFCSFPSDRSVFLGYASTALLMAATVAGYFSVFYPYDGKSIPRAAVFSSGWCSTNIYVAVASAILGIVFLLWQSIEEQLHRTMNVHKDLNYDCPTAKTGLFGGGAFVSLNSALFWLMALLIVTNVREDYFETTEKNVV
ncbi:hypothetical protein M569_09730, partial [Genlisea aurea]